MHVGNVGSPIQRLPLFRTLLLHPGLLATRSARNGSGAVEVPAVDVTILAIPPRSFGLSTNRTPTQKGLLDDYEAVVRRAVQYREEKARATGDDVRIVWMGHSLGASIAACLLERVTSQRSTTASGEKRASDSEADTPDLIPDGFVYENGFASISRMVSALYPQRWLPYHYLGGLAWDRWEAIEALGRVAQNRNASLAGRTVPALFLSSSQDELVPPQMVRTAYEAATGGGNGALDTRFVPIPGALHDFAFRKQIWANELVKFLREVGVCSRNVQGDPRHPQRLDFAAEIGEYEETKTPGSDTDKPPA